MTVHLSIPSPSEDWRVFDVGQALRDLGLTWFTFPLAIHAYALCILAGILAAGIVTGIRLRNRGADPGLVYDIGIWAVLLGIAGGRIFHVLTHPDDYFFPGANLWRVFFIWEGGLAIFGALLFGALGVYLGCRATGLRFTTFADALAPGLLLAQALGRLGNWFNQELFGLPTDLPWGLEIDSSNAAIPVGLPEGTLFHPTFLYEILWNLAGIAVLLLAERRYRRRSSLAGQSADGAGGHRLVAVGWRLQWGRLIGLYLVWYGIGRTVFESIRIDPSEVLTGLRVNVWAALIAIALGVAIIVIQGRRHPGLEPSPYLPGRAPSDTAEVDSDSYPDAGGDDAPEEPDSGSVELLPSATSATNARP